MLLFHARIPIILVFILWAGCQSAPSFDFGSYSEAERYYEKKEYEKAIQKYEEYIRENRQGNMVAIACYYTAKSYQALRRPQEARPYYQRIVDEHPQSIWADFAKTRLEELPSEAV